MKKILFLDAVHPILEERLNNMGYACEYDFTSTKEVIEAKVSDFFGIVIRSRFPIDAVFLNRAKKLKFIARSGAGLENIDLLAAGELGVEVFNSPEGNMDAVGEHAIGMLLSLFHQLKKGDLEVRKGVWDREGNRGLELAGKTVAIIGFGKMGGAFAKKLKGFDCKVIAYDKYKTGFSNDFVEEVTLEKIFLEANILSIHLPLSEETKHYVNSNFLSQFENGIYLINTARGNNICTADLVEAIKNSQVLGACLDVLEYETKSFEKINVEELPEDFLFLTKSEKVILSPHVAGWTKESYIKLSSFLADKIEKQFN